MHVLIADGTGGIAAPGIVFLSLWGHEVETARDGLEAFRRAKARPPDLVLASLALDRMDGLSLAAALRTNAATRNVRFVLATERTDGEVRRRFRAMGLEACVTSPVDVPELRGVVDRIDARLRLRTRAA